MAVFALLSGCAKGAEPGLDPIPPETVRVGERLRVPITLRNGTCEEFALAFETRDAEFGRTLGTTVRIRCSSLFGGYFQWTPTARHVGVHDFRFMLTTKSGDVLDSQETVLTVEPGARSAPIFLQPGMGANFEPGTPVGFTVEIADNDSPTVEIRALGSLPDGAALTTTGPKSATFAWTPTEAQLEESLFWTVELEADDGDHEPVRHRFDIALIGRTTAPPECPGEPPTITVVAPENGSLVSSGSGYEVRVQISDDRGLPNPAHLHYSLEPPADPEDLTQYLEAIRLEKHEEVYTAEIAGLDIAPGESQSVYFVVSAVDDDDPMSRECDHLALSSLVQFEAAVDPDGPELEDCSTCASSQECQSGFCVSTAIGGRCMPACGGPSGACALGACGAVTSVEGAVGQACGNLPTVCMEDDGSDIDPSPDGGTGGCQDDRHEDNDTVEAARQMTGTIAATICSNDDDYYRVLITSGDRVEITIDGFVHAVGDLDLFVLDPTGATLQVCGSGSSPCRSAGVEDQESVSLCAASDLELYIRVLGYNGASNDYQLRVQQSHDDC